MPAFYNREKARSFVPLFVRCAFVVQKTSKPYNMTKENKSNRDLSSPLGGQETAAYLCTP